MSALGGFSPGERVGSLRADVCIRSSNVPFGTVLAPVLNTSLSILSTHVYGEHLFNDVTRVPGPLNWQNAYRRAALASQHTHTRARAVVASGAAARPARRHIPLPLKSHLFK